METVYLKGFCRKWHSDKEDLNSYFENYSHSFTSVYKNKTSISGIFKSVLPCALAMKRKGFIGRQIEEFTKELKSIGQTKEKTIFKEKQKPKVVSTKKNLSGRPGKKSRTKKPSKPCQNNSCTLDLKVPKKTVEQPLSDQSTGFQGLKQSRYKNNVIISRSELLLDPTDKSRMNNIEIGKDFIVSFRIHEPYAHYEDKNIENFQQEILVLGYQTLDLLRDKIICRSDFQDIQGDLSENPDKPITRMTRDVCKSAMFYLDNTFYIDTRQLGSEDYSKMIKKWGETRGIAFGKTLDMSYQSVSQIKLCFGYPYLYMHQGCCEHLVIVNDARLVTGKDSLSSYDYPLLSRIPQHITENCYVCMYSLATWIVVASSRMLYDTTYMCECCFKMFHYVNGKKIGNFKAYRYCQKNRLL